MGTYAVVLAVLLGESQEVEETVRKPRIYLRFWPRIVSATDKVCHRTIKTQLIDFKAPKGVEVFPNRSGMARARLILVGVPFVGLLGDPEYAF